MTNDYQQLVSKLKTFKRKFYLYRLLRGIFLVIGLLIFYFTAISLFEYFEYSSVFARTVLFIFSLLLVAFEFVLLILIPVAKLFGLLSPLSDIDSSRIISKHFNEIEDKLLNILELAEEFDDANELALASIDKKIDKIKVFDFSEAVERKQFQVPLLILSVAVICTVITQITFPGVYSESSYRLIHFNQSFTKPAPFTFKLLNQSLKVKKGESVNIEVVCEGKEFPEVVYINIGGTNFLMSGEQGKFSYRIDQVHNNFSIYFTDGQFVSDEYQIETLANPAILDFSVFVDPPGYTNYQSEKLNNNGDLKVPFGTKLSFEFNTVDTDSLLVRFSNFSPDVVKNDSRFITSYQVRENTDYTVSLKNSFFTIPDLLQYNVEVIPDLFPEIKIVQLRDSMDFNKFYFKGSISDDYGFHDLSFNLVINQKDSIFDIPVLKNLSEQDFYFSFDFSEIRSLTNQVSYYFRVSDNDYFHNFKETTSEAFQFHFPSHDELLQSDNQLFNNIQDLLEKSFDLSDELKKSIEDLKMKSISENISDWEKQQLMNEILNKKNQLENILDQVKKNNSEMNRMNNSFMDEKAELLKQQEQIQQLLDEVMNDELKALFDEFNKLAKEFDQQQFDNLMNNADMALDDLSKQLDRNLQMLKRMKIEQKLEQLIELLSDLSNSERLNSNIIDTEKDYLKVIDNEKENSQLINSVKEELNTIFELNATLDKPMKLFPVDTEIENIQSKYDEVLKLLEGKRNNKAVKSINENADLIDGLAFLLQRMLDGNRMQQAAENIENLKQILDNLIYLSVNQEDLLHLGSGINQSDPLFNTIKLRQDRLIEQSTVVKDSLYALAKRTPAISSKVNEELIKLDFSLRKAVADLEDANIGSVLRYQQNAVTSANELALFLNEALENLEKQLANSMPGDQQCDKPGKNGKSGMNMMKQAQQSLKDQLQQMIEQMKSGDGKLMNQQLGKTLAQHEMLQQMVREMLTDTEVGSAAKEQLKEIDLLIEQNRIDLINKNVSSSMINRQNLILNKLLKAEKAEMERDIEDERESKTADDKFYSNPAEFFEYKKADENNSEEIRYNNFKLRNYYDQKYKKYINQLNK